MKTKFGIKQWSKPAPDKVKVICEAVAYLMVGAAGISYVAKNADLSALILLVAGAIDKYVPRLFGVSANSTQDENI